MNASLDVVIPVLMPSAHISQMRDKLSSICNRIKIIYVLDYKNGITPESKKLFSNNSNEVFIFGSFGSPGKARNAGLKACTAEYVCFWDVDDSPKMTEFCKLIEADLLFGADLIIGKWTTSNKKDRIHGNKPYELGLHPGVWRCIVKRNFISNIQFAGTMWAEDQVFLAEILLKSPTIWILDSVLYEYFEDSPNSLTNGFNYSDQLLEASRGCIQVLSNARDSALSVIALMLVRQSLTMAKFGSIRSKIGAIKIVIITSYYFIKMSNKGRLLKPFFEWS